MTAAKGWQSGKEMKVGVGMGSVRKDVEVRVSEMHKWERLLGGDPSIRVVLPPHLPSTTPSGSFTLLYIDYLCNPCLFCIALFVLGAVVTGAT